MPLEIPFFIKNIAQLKTVSPDLPTLLAKLDEDIKSFGSYFRLDADHNLKLMKLPTRYEYPPLDEFQDIMSSTHGKWVNLVGQIAVAARLPLLQFGHIRFHEKTEHSKQFARVTVPFIDSEYRFVNFRIITLTFLPDTKDWMI